MKTVTAVTTTGVLGTLFVRKFIKRQSIIPEIDTLERVILGVATAQYGLTFAFKSDRRIQRYRFLDWLITTPLLLKTFHSLAVHKGFKGRFEIPALFNFLMIYAGYHAEFLAKSPQEKRLWTYLGFIGLVVVLLYVRRWDVYLKSQGVDTRQLPTFFYVGWTAYGAIFLLQNEEARQSAFNVLDLFNKGIYSLHLEAVLASL